MEGIDIEKAIIGLKDGTLIAVPSDYLELLRTEHDRLKESLEHIKDVLLAAIARPSDIAIGWEGFLLKFIDQALKEKQ